MVFGLSDFVKREETNSCLSLRSLLQCLLRGPLGAQMRKLSKDHQVGGTQEAAGTFLPSYAHRERGR